MSKIHTTNLRFLGAVGEVTPSSTIVSHEFQRRSTAIMVDAGITPGNRERLMIPTGIDALVLSHAHVDHVGELPQFFVQNPESHIFVPRGNKEIIAHNVAESHRLSMQENPEAKMGRWLNVAQEILDEVYTNMPKKSGVKRGKSGNRIEQSISKHDLKNTYREQESKLESAIYQLSNHLNIDESAIDNMPDDKIVSFFRTKIHEAYSEKLNELKERRVITRGDVARSINAITELTIGSCHKIIKLGLRDVRVRFDPTGHLVVGPACSVGLELPIPATRREILFSGDQGNPKLGYEGTNPDFKDLYNKYHTIVMESTYGDKVHPDRADELRKLDGKILEAVRSQTDVLIVSLALERPVYVLYEILKCLENSGISTNDVDISYFGESIGTLFKHFPKGEIRDTVKPFMKPLITPAAPPRQKLSTLSKLGKKGPRTRIIIASCGFFHPEGPSAKALAHMYHLENLLILSPNFHGEPGTNGYNLFQGEEYQIGPDYYEPKPGHDLFVAKGFSAHGDSDHLVRYARKNAIDGKSGKGAKIFLNHGSERARDMLANKLSNDPVIKSKNAHIILPKPGRSYKANQ